MLSNNIKMRLTSSQAGYSEDSSRGDAEIYPCDGHGYLLRTARYHERQEGRWSGFWVHRQYCVDGTVSEQVTESANAVHERQEARDRQQRSTKIELVMMNFVDGGLTSLQHSQSVASIFCLCSLLRTTWLN